MDNKPPPTSIRLSPEAQALIRALGAKLGLTRTSVIEMAVRKLAEGEGIPIPKKTK